MVFKAIKRAGWLHHFHYCSKCYNTLFSKHLALPSDKLGNYNPTIYHELPCPICPHPGSYLWTPQIHDQPKPRIPFYESVSWYHFQHLSCVSQNPNRNKWHFQIGIIQKCGQYWKSRAGSSGTAATSWLKWQGRIDLWNWEGENHVHAFFVSVAVQSLSCVRIFATPWTAAHQASLPSLSPGAGSNSCPLSQWCHPTISSSVAPFSSCPVFPSIRVFSNQEKLVTSGGQSIRAST